MRYMLDTDICSYVMKRFHPALLEKLQTVDVSQVCLSVVTKAELLYGVRMSPDPTRDARAVRGFLAYVEVLELPGEAAQHYAEIRADLKRGGRLIGANDLFIAAHARCLDLTLVTHNTGEFSRVEGLSLEDWVV